MTAEGAHRILIVEDDHEIQYLLSVVLAGEGREVIAATTGAEAREALAGGDVDLVVLDLILPDVDGRTLLTEMRGHPETAEVPVVVVTARTGPQSRQESYSLGADAFVEKPFDPDELSEDIAVRLERAARAERMAFTDSLTGLLNRAGLRPACDEAENGFGLGLVELDGFGALSERWGTDRTDQVVVALTRALQAAVGDDAILARTGRSEFAVLTPGSDLQALEAVAARLRDVVHGLSLEPAGEDGDRLSATLGVLTLEAGTDLEEALDLARQRIFQARERGGGPDDGEGAPERRSSRVVVAEDDEISATILIHRLEKEGLNVVRYDNGQDAYDGALADPPDLVILDVKMPGLDGFEVLERLRREPRFTKVPVILLTSMGQEADVVRGFRLGADDYILKPFSPIELSARVRRLLTRGRSTSPV